MEKTAYLVLENGTVFQGKTFGAEREAIAEIVFTTGMTGYMETLTDKSYYGQGIVQTFPLIGNYGVISGDRESDRIWAQAYIVRDWCREPSNFRCEGDIDAFLKAQNTVGLYDLDTRALTKIIRESGVMNGAITFDPKSVDLEALRAYHVEGAVAAVSVKEPVYCAAENSRYTVALLDFGLKENIRRSLLAHGCNLWLLPHDTSADAVLSYRPDGVMLSNGPGDPTENPAAIETLRQLLQTKLPIFGICLGHQLLALANGFTTAKLKYGHRGGNQPVRDIKTGRIYTTSQNHGYTVVSESIDPARARESFVNLNDHTCEGIEYLHAPVFSAQFHPEGCGGPQDTSFLFDHFIALMQKAKQ